MSDNLDHVSMLIELQNSEEWIKLVEYYNYNTIFNTLGISRDENRHSSFLSWLFSPPETHELGDFALKRLLELCVIANKQQTGIALPIGHDCITLRDYELSNITVKREYAIGNGRLDIFIEFELNDKKKNTDTRYAVIIENKIKAKESADQTITYYNWGEQTDKKIIYLFLTPLKKQKSKDSHFLKIDYQQVLDYILLPSLRNCKNKRAISFIDEYIRTLGKPPLNNEKEKDNTVMAIPQNEKNLIKAFYEKNKDFISTLIDVIANDEDNELTDRERDILNNASNAIRKRFDPADFDIPAGAIFRFKHKKSIEIKVLGDRQYEYCNDKNGETNKGFLKHMTIKACEEVGRNFYPGDIVNSWLYTLNGKEVNIKDIQTGKSF